MAEFQEKGPRGPVEHRREPTRAAVLVPVFRQRSEAENRATPGLEPARRSDDARLAEAVGLAAAIDLDIVASSIVTGQKPQPATLIGSGKVEELKGLVAAEAVGLVIVDHPLTPVQQRNLEKELETKVLDRTGLILEIFGRRARTKEGRLQVELAHLNYQRGRLVRSWTHLERQRGGAGFMGGPGETQIEADRRQLQEKIKRLEKELEQVRRTRQLHRAKRRKRPHPIVALVGYTNAGKSTLFNLLTGADVMARDLLFATLDPTLRKTVLPHGTEILFSDTVGFVSDLPTHLVAAFRATLEEVIEADLILHVRDIADPDTLAQAEDVRRILRDLDVDTEDTDHVVEVWNKIDRLDEDALHLVAASRASLAHPDAAFLVSAVTGEGTEALLADIERRIAGNMTDVSLDVRPEAMSFIPWLYDNATVLAREDGEDGVVHLKAEMTASARAELRRLGASSDGITIAG
ncbi:GTPase HflX [Jiella endophytica]|uniref:GTPase HflX n=1 Tax=Jiella endophytica TaxID=2558362 RepID=A0A4Y8REL9_9HYPH|nr:GTPase HflX [Jiella endophytica]TFF20756.1 GTPase HflX [Jiella endophytica]TFF27057.1 GTPase HflX [Jiella endophytica]